MKARNRRRRWARSSRSRRRAFPAVGAGVASRSGVCGPRSLRVGASLPTTPHPNRGRSRRRTITALTSRAGRTWRRDALASLVPVIVSDERDEAVDPGIRPSVREAVTHVDHCHQPCDRRDEASAFGELSLQLCRNCRRLR